MILLACIAPAAVVFAAFWLLPMVQLVLLPASKGWATYFVVLTERLTSIAETRRTALRTMRVARQNLAWSAAYNAVGVPMAMMGWVSAWLAGLGMAASSLLVVLNALRLASTQEEPG